MELQTSSQTYLVPATSQALNKALATLAALGLSHEEPRAANVPAQQFFTLVVQVPIIPVVHRFDLVELRSTLVDERKKRVERPSHREASGWNIEPLTSVYSDDFFSGPTQSALTYSITDLVVREHIIKHFSEQDITVQKITLSKPATEVLGAMRFLSQDDWYAFVEEARPLLPELATLLGAV
jgi:hypothetical protein